MSLEVENILSHPVTEEDIFDDIRDLAHKVSDDAEKERLSSLIEVKKNEFNMKYDDTESMNPANFLIKFCFDMEMMLQEWGNPNLSFDQRIKKQLQSYYKNAPMSLKLDKLKSLSAPAEAPTKVEGGRFGEFLMNAAKVYNEDLGFTGAGWVRHRCIELLSEGGKRVSDTLRQDVLTLQRPV